MSEITYKVRLLGSDGREYIISLEGLRSTLERVNPERNILIETLRGDVAELAKIIREETLIPKMRKEIVNFLKSNPNIATREFNSYGYRWKGERCSAWFEAKELLEAEGVIVSVKQGLGKNRLWKLKEARQ